jgi:hypothetical protein
VEDSVRIWLIWGMWQAMMAMRSMLEESQWQLAPDVLYVMM